MISFLWDCHNLKELICALKHLQMCNIQVTDTCIKYLKKMQIYK